MKVAITRSPGVPWLSREHRRRQPRRARFWQGQVLTNATRCSRRWVSLCERAERLTGQEPGGWMLSRLVKDTSQE